MALVRILVDGYSLLHNWPELAEGRPRHSEAARDALVELLTHYQDACGMPVTVFFDGRGSRKTKPKNTAGKPVEVLVVTDDLAERDTVSAFGSSVASCDNFIRSIQNALADLQENLNNHNRSERNRFFRSR